MNTVTNEEVRSVRAHEDNSCCFRALTGNAVRLIFEITRRCNLHCTHCMVSGSMNHPVGISHDRIMRLMRELKANNISKIMFTGGEPLLAEHIVDYVRAASDDGLVVDLNSNLTLATDAMIRALCVAGIREVTTSIDGSEATHCGIRGDKSCYRNTIRAIEGFTRRGVNVDVVCTLMDSNLHEAESVWQLCENIGVASLTFSGLIIDGRAQQGQATYTTGEVRRIIGALRERSKIPVRTVRLLNEDYSCCHKGIDMIGIAHDGSVHPCLQDKLQSSMNISDHTLAECMSFVRESNDRCCQCAL